MDIDAIPVVLSYGVVFSIVTAIFVYCTDRKKGDIDDLAKKRKKCHKKLRQIVAEIYHCDGIEALKKSVIKARATLSPYYGYASIVLDGSVIDGIITELNNESDNTNLESRRLEVVKAIDIVSKAVWECTEREINSNSLTKNLITIVMLDFFFFTTWYLMKNTSLCLLRGRGIEDVPLFSDINTYLWSCAIIANVVFVFILGINYKNSK